MFVRNLLALFAAATMVAVLSVPSACQRDSVSADSSTVSGTSSVAGATASKEAAAKEKGPTEVIVVSDSDFDRKVLKADRPVLVDFYADWCGPCKMLAPTLAELAKEYDGNVIFAKLNVDHNRKTSNTYGIRSLPTMMVFQKGKPAKTLIGLMPKASIKTMIDDVK